MTEAQRAHLRLLHQPLPRRTHIRAAEQEGRGGLKQTRPVAVGDETYPSFRACWRALRVSPLTVAKWIREGKARYA